MKLTAPLHWSARLLVPAAVLVGGLIFLHYFGKLQGLFEHGADAAISSGHTEVKTEHAYQAGTAKLRKSQARHAATEQAEADSARAWRDSANKLLAKKPPTGPPDPLANFWRNADIHDSTALHQCNAVVLSCEARARADSARADSVTRLLQPLLHKADCHVLGVGFLPRCLTRTQSYLAGGGTVVLLRLLGIIK